MEIVNRRVDDLIPYAKNTKLHDKKQIGNVANSIKRFGWQQPIVVDDKGVVVIGHCRLLAAKKLGMPEVPCTVASGLTEQEIRELRIADNKTNESPWDLDLLADEMQTLTFDGFDFNLLDTPNDWFDRKIKDGKNTEGEDEEYKEFVEKFEPKKTTDDCYTPENIYEAVAEWVKEEYGLDRNVFVRPFYPGGDYKKEKYRNNSVVVDNPPFSILAEIIRFYQEKEIKFFLFAPTLTLFSSRKQKGITYIPVGASVTYENGAEVNTSFITNMDACKIRTAPLLYKAVNEKNKENLRKIKKEFPEYSYPDHVVTAAMVARWCKYGIEFRVNENECMGIAELDAQKEAGKAIFGGGFLLSERAAAERAAAERAAAERAAAERAAAERAAAEQKDAMRWELSARESKIVEEMSR